MVKWALFATLVTIVYCLGGGTKVLVFITWGTDVVVNWVLFPLILLLYKSTLSGIKILFLTAVSLTKFLAYLNPNPRTSCLKGYLHCPYSQWSPTTFTTF